MFWIEHWIDRLEVHFLYLFDLADGFRDIGGAYMICTIALLRP